MIGPTFAEELTAAGVLDRRFSWGADGTLFFAPEMPDEEREKVEAVLAAHDGPLSVARAQALEAVRAEGSERIARLFAQPADTLDLVFAELNTLAGAVAILEKGPSALPEERLDLEGRKEMWARIQAIRDVGRAARTALAAAKSVEEVQAVKVVWPED